MLAKKYSSIFLIALAAGVVTRPCLAQSSPRPASDTRFEVPLPGRTELDGGGSILHVTAIGPEAGNRIIGTTFEINWASDGVTPASDLELVVTVQVDGESRHRAVTGKELGFTGGRGIFRGELWTDALDGLVWQPSGFPHSLVEIEVQAVGGRPVEGRAAFIQASIVFEMIPADADLHTETFEDLTNEAGWTYGTGAELLDPTGGNPGTFLHDDFVFSFGPAASTSFGVSSDFTGDYRSRGVIALGIDLKTFSVSGNVGSRKLSLVLTNDNGTPFDFGDDWGAYVLGRKTIPLVVGVSSFGWESYDFLVPAAARHTPREWTWFGSRAGRTWQDLMSDVSSVQFFYGDPGVPQLLHEWNVGLDNPRIATRLSRR